MERSEFSIAELAPNKHWTTTEHQPNNNECSRARIPKPKA